MTTTVHKLLIEAEADTKGVTKMQKELNTLYKDQQKSTKNAAAANLKAKTQSKEVAKLTGPDAIKKQDAAAKRLLETEKKLTAEARKQAQIAKDLKATNRLAQRTTFGGGFRKAMGFRQPGDAEGPNWRSRLGAAVGGGFRTGIGLAGGGLTALAMAPIAALGANYQAYTTYANSAARLTHMGAGTPFARRGGLRGGFGPGGDLMSLADRGAALGYMPEETIDALHTMGRSVGTSGALGATDLGMGASRLTGQSIQELSQFMAEQRRGSGAFGTQQRREFQQVLQTAVEAGMDASTLPEYMEGIQTLLQGANQRGGTNSPSQIATLLAMAQQTGAAGLQGARGVSTVSGVDQGIRNAGNINMGMGNFFNALVMQQAGLGRGASYTSAAGRAQQGLLQPGGLDLADVRAVINRARSSGLSGSLLNQGLVDAGWAQTQTQAQDVLTLADQPGSDAQLRALLQRTSETELDVQHEIADNTAAIAAFLGTAEGSGAVRGASIAMEDVHNAEVQQDVLNELQNIMRDFLHEVQGPLHDVLVQLPDLLRPLTDGMANLAHVLAHPLDSMQLYRPEEMAEFAQLNANEAASIQNAALALQSDDVTALRTAQEQLLSEQDAYNALMDREGVAQRRSLGGETWAGSLDQDIRQNQAIANALDRIAARLEALSPVVHLDEVRIVAQDGLSATPPSPRAAVSTTGSGR